MFTPDIATGGGIADRILAELLVVYGPLLKCLGIIGAVLLIVRVVIEKKSVGRYRG